jgi:hypothetical protein
MSKTIGADFQSLGGSIRLDSSYNTIRARGDVMYARRHMPKHLVLATVAFLVAATGAASAAECFPHCDYTHYYGPFDFTYIQPDLFGYPLCGPRGNCSPQLAYSTSGIRRGRITVRFPRATTL